jgi:hypothetical protein
MVRGLQEMHMAELERRGFLSSRLLRLIKERKHESDEQEESLLFGGPPSRTLESDRLSPPPPQVAEARSIVPIAIKT